MRLRVLEVIEKGWLRSQLLVEAEESGELFFGNFRYLVAAAPGFQVHRYAVTRGQQLYLVCRGGGWRIGDDVPAGKIVYRYEP